MALPANIGMLPGSALELQIEMPDLLAGSSKKEESFFFFFIQFYGKSASSHQHPEVPHPQCQWETIQYLDKHVSCKFKN